MQDSFAVILNANSGSQKVEEKLRQLKQEFAAQNFKPEIFLAHDANALADSAQKALTLGFGKVVAAGGDGTVNVVAAEVLRANSILGILPLGTLNHLAKDLGIPQDLKGAIETLVSGRVIAIDAGQVNGKIFINNSSIGLYPKLVKLRQEHQKLGKGKWLAFLAALVNLLKQYSFYNARIQIKGKDVFLRTPFVFVGNNKYEVEGLNIGTRERMDNSELSVYVMRHSTVWGLVNLTWRALFGGLAEHKDFDVYTTNQAKIDTKKRFLPVSLDGEVSTLETPLEYSILPQALKVMVPKI